MTSFQLTPKISIIIVVKNAIKTIEQAIESIISQSYKNYEILIIDGLSTDGTLAVIEKYQDYISYSKSENDKGIYDAMNKSILKCSGDYIYFLGADDELYDKDVLSKVFESNYQKNEIIYGNAYYIGRKKIRFGRMNRYHLSKHNFNHQTIFYPRSVFDNYIYEIKYRIWADYLLNINLFYLSKFKFRYANVIISKFNDMGTSGIHNIDFKFVEDRKQITKLIFPLDVYIFYKARRIFLTFQKHFKRNK